MIVFADASSLSAARSQEKAAADATRQLIALAKPAS